MESYLTDLRNKAVNRELITKDQLRDDLDKLQARLGLPPEELKKSLKSKMSIALEEYPTFAGTDEEFIAKYSEYPEVLET